jgi:hypothetical protein
MKRNPTSNSEIERAADRPVKDSVAKRRRKVRPAFANRENFCVGIRKAVRLS